MSTSSLPAAPDNAALAHIELRWGDMDAYQHINNAQILRILEEARVRGFASAASQEIVARGILVARHEIEYRLPIPYSLEPIEVALWISRIGNSGFDVAYYVQQKGNPAQVYVIAESTLVLFDLAAGTTRRLDDEDRKSLQQLAGPEVPFRRRTNAL